MSPYASELAHARLDALRTLVGALNEAETPEEKRRCAVAILSAPDPCDLDDEIELVDDEDDENEDLENQDSETQDQSDAEENPAAEDAAQYEGRTPTSDIRHRTSDIPPDLSDESINAKAATDLDREAMDQLVAPS